MEAVPPPPAYAATAERRIYEGVIRRVDLINNVNTSKKVKSQQNWGHLPMLTIAEVKEMESLDGKVNPSPVAPEDAPLEFSVKNNAPESPQRPKDRRFIGVSRRSTFGY